MTEGFAGKFITLEGGEGVGKSTLVKRLIDWLRSRGVTVVVTREPGGTPVADGIRQLFKVPPESESMTPETEALLVCAARAQHVSQVILPALKRGDWVVCDRYTDSTRVYQGLLGGVPMNELEWLIRFSTGGLNPDMTLLLECDVDLALQRIQKSGASRDDAARYDQADRTVHERLKNGFRKVAGFFPARFFILDASSSPDAVFASATKELEARWLKQ